MNLEPKMINSMVAFQQGFIKTFFAFCVFQFTHLFPILYCIFRTFNNFFFIFSLKVISPLSYSHIFTLTYSLLILSICKTFISWLQIYFDFIPSESLFVLVQTLVKVCCLQTIANISLCVIAQALQWAMVLKFLTKVKNRNYIMQKYSSKNTKHF